MKFNTPRKQLFKTQHKVKKIIYSQKKEKRSITVAHKEQINYLKNIWGKYFQSLRQREKEILQFFKLSQKQQAQIACQRFQKRCRFLRSTNSNIIELHKAQKYLLQMGDFQGLIHIRKQIQRSIQKQQQNRQKLMLEWANAQRKKLNIGQSKRYSTIFTKLQDFRRDKYNIYQFQHKRLQQKYKNVLVQLSHDQNIELYHSQQLLSLSLHHQPV